MSDYESAQISSKDERREESSVSTTFLSSWRPDQDLDRSAKTRNYHDYSFQSSDHDTPTTTSSELKESKRRRSRARRETSSSYSSIRMAHLGGAGRGGQHKKRKKDKEEWSGDRVYVQRDYTQGSRPVRFQEEVPVQLEHLISQDEFAATIRKVNELYAEAEETNMTTWCEGMLGCLTAHLIFLCFSTSYDRVLVRVADLLEEENERVWMAKGLVIRDPALTGLRVIEIARIDKKR